MRRRSVGFPADGTLALAAWQLAWTETGQASQSDFTLRFHRRGSVAGLGAGVNHHVCVTRGAEERSSRSAAKA